MKFAKTRNRAAFSLIELVIVIVILGALTAIAIPRVTRGSDGADVTAMQADLAVVRNAIEMYRLDHAAYPTLVAFSDSLTLKSDKDGTINASGLYGPYLVSIPKQKVGNRQGENAAVAPAAVPPVVEEASGGWLYDAASGGFWANATGHFDK